MRKLFVAAMLPLFAGTASAAGLGAITVTDVVSDISAQSAPVTAIGGAVLLLLVAIKAFKWVRRAL